MIGMIWTMTAFSMIIFKRGARIVMVPAKNGGSIDMPRTAILAGGNSTGTTLE